ncbi:hypothetical protein [Dyadobacter bucti]|uniref:hypothetical protein n=1 Tax=Dyadobacter bucti TaxID=2572203 RepID=UPI003F6F0BEE
MKEDSLQPAKTKKAYNKPVLKTHGTLRKITRALGKLGSSFDAANNMSNFEE